MVARASWDEDGRLIDLVVDPEPPHDFAGAPHVHLEYGSPLCAPSLRAIGSTLHVDVEDLRFPMTEADHHPLAIFGSTGPTELAFRCHSLDGRIERITRAREGDERTTEARFTWRHDALDRWVELEMGDGRVFRRRWSESGLPAADVVIARDGAGRARPWRTYFEENGRLVRVDHGEAASMQNVWEYDEAGRVIASRERVSTLAERVSRYRYDDDDRIIEITVDEDGRRLLGYAHRYDAHGRLVRTVIAAAEGGDAVWSARYECEGS